MHKNRISSEGDVKMVTLKDLYNIRKNVIELQEVIENNVLYYSTNTKEFKLFNQIYTISIKIYNKTQGMINDLLNEEIIANKGGDHD